MQMHLKKYYNFSSDKQILLWIVFQMREDRRIVRNHFICGAQLEKVLEKTETMAEKFFLCFIV